MMWNNRNYTKGSEPWRGPRNLRWSLDRRFKTSHRVLTSVSWASSKDENLGIGVFQKVARQDAIGLHSIPLRRDVGFKVFKTGEFQFGIYESISLVYPIGDEYHGLFPRFPALL